MADSAFTVSSFFQEVASYVNWDSINSFANSNFSSSLVGAVAGAFAGAYAAQRIAERHKLRQELLTEIRNTNAAISLAFTICNSVLELKKQHLVGLKKSYDKEREAFLEHMGLRSAGDVPADAVYNFRADLQMLPYLTLPTDIFRTQVFERLSVIGRPLALVTKVFQSAFQTNEAIARRNQLIEKYRSISANDHNHFVELYFGLPFGNGHIDSEYPDTLSAVCTYADDLVFFTSLLCDDLQAHGQELVGRYKERFRGKVPIVNEVDFDKARRGDLMPNPENYTDWLKSFIKKI